MSELGLIPIVVVVVAAIIAGGTDLWHFRVYNALTFPLMACGMAYHLLMAGWPGLVGSACGLLFGFAVLILPHLVGLMGAGDVKLMAGIGAWFGFAMTGYVFVATSLVAGVVSVGLILYRGKVQESWSTIRMILNRFMLAPAYFGKDDFVSVVAKGPDRRLRAIPFAAMVPPGLIVAFLCQSSLIQLFQSQSLP